MLADGTRDRFDVGMEEDMEISLSRIDKRTNSRNSLL